MTLLSIDVSMYLSCIHSWCHHYFGQSGNSPRLLLLPDQADCNYLLGIYHFQGCCKCHMQGDQLSFSASVHDSVWKYSAEDWRMGEQSI